MRAPDRAGTLEADGMPDPDGMLDPDGMPDLAGFREALLDHFDRTRRDLPWRSGRTPYRVLVSEFMLQQTRAATVAPYFVRWLRRFPGWEELADASWDEVMRQWKGLGYYARARNLQRTATLVRERHGGRLPKDPATLRELPGVGEYTAGAVASIAFGLPVAAVDGNVRRVLCRLLDEGDPSPARLRAEAARLLDPRRPGDFNEAMMELGATVCTPRRPSCRVCPVAGWCRARAAGTAPDRPLPRPRRKMRSATYAVAVALDGAGRTLLTRRPAQGLLAGTWEFPATELGSADGVEGSAGGAKSGRAPEASLAERRPGRVLAASPAAQAELTAAVCGRLVEAGVVGKVAAALEPVRRTFTHLHAVYHPVVVECATEALDLPTLADDQVLRTSFRHLDELPLPVAQQQIADRARQWLQGSGRPVTLDRR